MRDLIVDLADPVFTFNLVDYPSEFTNENLVTMQDVSASVYVEPTVEEVNKIEEIMLLRAAAQEALNGTR